MDGIASPLVFYLWEKVCQELDAKWGRRKERCGNRP